MTDFKKRYRKYCFNNFIKSLKPWHYIIAAAVYVLLILGSGHEYGFFGYIIGVIDGAFLILAVLLIVPSVDVSNNGDLYSILDQCGFSREYLAAYEKARIIGKPLNLKYAVDYAEIFYRIGQPADAIKYLNTINLPKNSYNNVRIKYFYVYVMSALNIHNLNIAEDIKKRNMPMINAAMTKPNYAKNVYLLYLALAAIELYAGQGDPKRLQSGCDLISEYLKSPSYKKDDMNNLEFEIFKLYALIKMDDTVNTDDLYEEIRRKAQSGDRLFASADKPMLDALQKARRGIVPFIN